jgi:2-(1,2-epoxy-1,2-dihydrophenyl)acetyl-CoA isomerase
LKIRKFLIFQFCNFQICYTLLMYKTLLVDTQDNALRIRLNRPEVLNALTLELLSELKEVLTHAAQQSDVRAVLLTAEGRGFCAGADLAATPFREVQEVVETYYNPVIQLLAMMPKPVVAAINGVAAGAGMSLTLACDMRFMSEGAMLTAGFTKIGLSLDAGMSFFLPRLVGRGRAFELAYGNRAITSAEALQLGLVEKVLPADGFADAAFAFAQELAHGPASFSLVKQLFNETSNDLEKQLRLEATLQAKAATSKDAAEGIRAFAEKRKAVFVGE